MRWSKGTLRTVVLIGFLVSAVGGGGVLPGADGAPPEIEHLHALAFDPQTNTLFIGTHHGLYTSTDEGKTWKEVEAGGALKGIDIMAFVMDPTNSQVLYIGTHQKGVLKSLDGGRTWEESNTGLGARDVHALSIHPPDKRLHAWVMDKGLYRSMDGGRTWKREDDGPPTDIKAMKDLGFEVLAVSRDDQHSASLMAAMLDSKIPVLSDPSMEMIRAYQMKGEGMEMADLGYVVIDIQGRIRARKIDRQFGENAQEIILILKRLKVEA